MDTIQRKIGFYSLKLKRLRKEKTYEPPDELKKVFSHILKLDEKDRVVEQKTPTAKRFHVLRKSKLSQDTQAILFVSAKFNHRPPLIDRDTAERRSNPKRLREGEEELTHIVLKYRKDEIVVLIEEHNPGISIGWLAKYLMILANSYYKSKDEKRKWKIENSVIPKDNFLCEMQKLSRVVIGEVHTEKKLLGSEFLNYSNKTDQVKDDLVLYLKAEKNKSILSPLEDIYRKYKKNDGEIIKIRVEGINEYGNRILLDTEIIKKIQHIDALANEDTGVIQSSELFRDMLSIIREY
jgi:hypothetical protein